MMKSKLANSGHLPTIRLGKRILVPRQALERLFEDAHGIKIAQSPVVMT